MLAVTIHSAVETSESVEVAQKIAREVGFRHLVIEHDDLANPHLYRIRWTAATIVN